MRTFYCNACATAEEMPDWAAKGKDDVDPFTEALALKHVEGNPRKHGVGDPDAIFSPFRLFHVPDEDWADPEKRKGAIAQMNQENKEAGFDGWVYDSHNTFKEDAMKCYNQHSRPKQGCIDWRDSSKLLGHPTDVGQKLAKENFKAAEQSGPHLCDFCPVKVFVETSVNFKKGLYKA